MINELSVEKIPLLNNHKKCSIHVTCCSLKFMQIKPRASCEVCAAQHDFVGQTFFCDSVYFCNYNLNEKKYFP